MNVIVTTTMCEVDNNTSMNSGEYNINKLHFTFSSAYLNEYVKKALFTIADGTAVEMVIENNECQIPNEVLRNPGTYLLGVYAYSIENNELILRYSPKPTSIYVNKGSYIENVVSPTTPTPNEFEQYYQAMQLLLTKAANKITLEINDSTYKLKAKLFDRNDNLLSESNEIDLPMENAVNNGTYDNENKKIVLTQINGETIDIPIDGILIETVDKITLEINNDTYKLKAKLFDRENQLISESNEIDLPMENAVNNGEYDNENKKIVLTQINGDTIDIPIGALINGLAYQNDVDTALNTKVDKVEGKQLSTNDFTNALKTKLDGIEDSADVNLIESISKNGTALTITNKNVDITVPTKTSDITNDSGFINKSVNNLTNYTTTSDMNTAISNAVGTETANRENADVALQNQIDAITSSSDVVDIVGTYAELQNYNTSTLTNDDVIKVLQDSTHNNALSYYRWTIVSRVGSWVYVGSEGPFYTKGETDTLLNTKYDKPTNGIPKTDLESAVQTSLGKADTAIQSSDLTDYVTKTDYGTSAVAGVIKSRNGLGISSTGVPTANASTYEAYQSAIDSLFIGKGTLENVITGKNLETANNKVTSIDENSTDIEYPSAKCVYNSQESQNEKINETNSEVDLIKKIYNAFPTVSNQAEKITLDGTAEVQFKNFELKGNTYQYSTTGANLLPQDKYIESTTRTGITYTNNGDGTFNLSGTATENYTLHIIPIDELELEANQPYYLYSSIPYDGITFNMSIPMTDGGTTKIMNVNSTYTPTTTPTNVRVQFYIASGQSVNAQNIKLMLVKGSSAPSEYEPYTGNQPSPNPDYPQDIHVVSGQNDITICGKNIINIPNGTYTNNTISVVANDGVLTINGTNSTTGNILVEFTGINHYTTNQNITMVRNADDISDNNAQLFLTINGTEYNMGNQTSHPDWRTLSYSGTITRLRLRIAPGTSYTNFKIKPMLYLGDYDSSILFEPYKEQSYTINLGDIELCKIGDYQDYIRKSTGKNLFNSNVEVKNAYPSTNVGNMISYTNSTATTSYVNCFYVKSGTTYTISYKKNTPSSISQRGSAIVDENNIILESLQLWDNNNTSITFTPIYSGYLVYACDKNTTNIQIEKGNQATTYEPYGKVWYKYGIIGKVVLDGSENWNLQSINSYGIANFSFVNNISDYIGNAVNKGTMCNYFLAQSNLISATKTPGYMLNPGKQLYLRINSSIVNTTETFKIWLSTHNTILYYALATPTVTEITDNTLIGQLNALEKAYSYDKQTNISQINADKPFIINTEAILSLKNVLDIEDELTTLDIGNGVD